jgi:AcrR family transcriptional regulator
VTTATRTERKNAATAQAVVRAALDLLVEGGTGAVTLDAIAERADVAVQTIYNRVGGRSAVLGAVAEMAYAANRRYMDEAYATQGSVVDRLRAVARAYTRFADEQPHQYRLLVNPPTSAGFDRAGVLTTEQNRKLSALLRHGIDEGILNDSLDPDRTATALWAMLDGVLSLAFRSDDAGVHGTELSALVGTVEVLLLEGLLRTAPVVPE